MICDRTGDEGKDIGGIILLLLFYNRNEIAREARVGNMVSGIDGLLRFIRV